MGIKENLSQLAQLIIDGKHIEVEKLTQQLLSAGTEPTLILDEGLLPGMDVVGQRFRDNQIFLPQVLVSARAMKASMKLLDPFLSAAKVKSKGKILIGTVKGDVHDIGKNIVAVLLQGAGYDIIDIGIDCSAEKFFSAYQQNRPDIVAMSALLTTTMVYMKTVIEYFRVHGVNVPVIVGGAPVNKKFADGIGAAGHARNAMDAVDLVRSILHEQRHA